MKKILFIVLLVQTFWLFGQGEIDDQEKIFYRNERTFAFLLNTNGYGANFRYAKRIDAFRKTLYEVEFDYLKHPKEQKTLTIYERRITYGKLNAAYVLKGAVGYQKELFKKRDLGGISIRYFTSVGPTFALLKPIYYQYVDISVDKGYYDDKFQNHLNYDAFIGKSTWSMGFDELTVSPGFFGKAGLSFEYSKINQLFHALEVGVGFDTYLKSVKIMDVPVEKWFFVLPDDHFIFTIFLSYRFGKVIDTMFNQSTNSIDNLIIE